MQEHLVPNLACAAMAFHATHSKFTTIWVDDVTHAHQSHSVIQYRLYKSLVCRCRERAHTFCRADGRRCGDGRRGQVVPMLDRARDQGFRGHPPTLLIADTVADGHH